ncbi:hypothetical protein E3J79_02430 [Candidatus Dependentiae bacterium]|nr:MAG: hypothetical protein E3J79_02430 [Candidatus Dependentiae bacterium]
MKRIILSFLGIAAFLTVGQAGARVIITNDTPYPIVAWVKFDLGREDFPKNSVDRKGEKVKEGVAGIPPYKSYKRTKDAAFIKRHWKVWVKENDIWQLVVDKKWSRAGGNIKAKVYMSVDPGSGENNFDITVFGY